MYISLNVDEGSGGQEEVEEGEEDRRGAEGDTRALRLVCFCCHASCARKDAVSSSSFLR
jgi:hypothetical protein